MANSAARDCRTSRGDARLNAPAKVLTIAMLAHQTVKSAFEPASETEVGAIDGEDQRVVEHHTVEPVWQDEFEPSGRPLPSVSSSHSMIQEKRCRCRSVGCRMEVAIVVE